MERQNPAPDLMVVVRGRRLALVLIVRDAVRRVVRIVAVATNAVTPPVDHVTDGGLELASEARDPGLVRRRVGEDEVGHVAAQAQGRCRKTLLASAGSQVLDRVLDEMHRLVPLPLQLLEFSGRGGSRSEFLVLLLHVAKLLDRDGPLVLVERASVCQEGSCFVERLGRIVLGVVESGSDELDSSAGVVLELLVGLAEPGGHVLDPQADIHGSDCDRHQKENEQVIGVERRSAVENTREIIRDVQRDPQYSDRHEGSCDDFQETWPLVVCRSFGCSGHHPSIGLLKQICGHGYL